ncbi:tail protein X [Sphingomonas melonis]|uniref:tail protein X n=1 Tax=Sphingomonas melonis TaxID=152682 RepID=UPI0035C7AC16
MVDTVTARQGDTLDGLLWRDRRIDIAGLPAVLLANPGLAARGAILAAGTTVTVPDNPTPAAPVRAVVQLWS